MKKRSGSYPPQSDGSSRKIEVGAMGAFRNPAIGVLKTSEPTALPGPPGRFAMNPNENSPFWTSPTPRTPTELVPPEWCGGLLGRHELIPLDHRDDIAGRRRTCSSDWNMPDDVQRVGKFQKKRWT